MDATIRQNRIEEASLASIGKDSGFFTSTHPAITQGHPAIQADLTCGKNSQNIFLDFCLQIASNGFAETSLDHGSARPRIYYVSPAIPSYSQLFPVSVIVNEVTVASKTTADSARFTLDLPDCPFKQLDVELIHTLGTKQFDTKIQLDIVTTPDLFLASATGQNVVPTTDSSNVQFATVIYRDLRGFELGNHRLTVKPLASGGIEFNLDQLKADEQCDATILYRREDGFVQQVVIPQFNPKSNPQSP